MATTEEAQVAADLAALDSAADELIAAIGRCADHVQAGRLNENAVLAKLLELQQRMMTS